MTPTIKVLTFALEKEEMFGYRVAVRDGQRIVSTTANYHSALDALRAALKWQRWAGMAPAEGRPSTIAATAPGGTSTPLQGE